MGRSEDGHADEEEERYHSDREITGIKPQKRDVYLSVLNPMGEAAFKSSRTKPLPEWMSMLPKNVHSKRKRSGYMNEEGTLETNEDQDDYASSSDGSTPTALTRVATAIWSPIDTPHEPERPIQEDSNTSTSLEQPCTVYSDLVSQARHHHQDTSIPLGTEGCYLAQGGKAIVPTSQYPSTSTSSESKHITPKTITTCTAGEICSGIGLPNECCDEEDHLTIRSSKRRQTVGAATTSQHLPPSSCHSLECIERPAAGTSRASVDKYAAAVSAKVFERIKRRRILGGKKGMADVVEGGEAGCAETVNGRSGFEECGDGGGGSAHGSLQKELKSLFREK